MITHHKYFQNLTNVVASRSNCLHRKVGAVIAKDNRVLTTGYNGAPAGMVHCIELGGCNKEQHGFGSGEGSEYCRAIHAEQNAILQAAKFGISIDGATLYCTHFPCTTCAKLIIGAGIKRIVYWHDYPNDLAKDLLEEAGVQMTFTGGDVDD